MFAKSSEHILFNTKKVLEGHSVMGSDTIERETDYLLDTETVGCLTQL